MRITFILQYYYPYIGGLENLFRHLAEGLAERGHMVRVITTRLYGTPLIEVVNNVRIERVRVPTIADRYFFSLFSIPQAIRASRQSDVVHTTPYAGPISGYIAARLSRKPIVFTALEILGRQWFKVTSNPLWAMVCRVWEFFIYHLPYDRFVAISQATLDDALKDGIKLDFGTVIHCGVDSDFYNPGTAPILRNRLGLSQDVFIYLYYGRPGITKGVDVLIRASQQIQKAIPNSCLVILLSTQPRRQYKQLCLLAESLKGQASIYMVQSVPRDELISYILGADCIVVPSLTEGFGFTTVEACAIGTPVVASKVGSIPEVISGKHILVEPGSPSALMAAILRVFKKQWDILPAKKFTWNAMVQSYEELYQELV